MSTAHSQNKAKCRSESNVREPIPVLLMARELGWGGGIERDVSKYARHLRNYGIAPHVACFRPGGQRWLEVQDAGVPTISVPVTSFRSPSVLSGARVLRNYIAENKIQVLHAFDLPTDLFGVPLGRLLGIPALSSNLWCRDLLPYFQRLMLAALDRLATGLFVNCHAVAENLHSRWLVPSCRIHVCHNGFEPTEFHADSRKRPSKLSKAKLVIGTLAVLREEKNIPLLIEAFPRVLNVESSARLMIVGDGPMKPQLQQQARELGISNACTFCDATASPAEFMRSMDVFVLPSRSEAFSNALLEAMACGCCPVASRVGGTPELVVHRERGFLFESGNAGELAEALCTLAEAPAVRHEMATAATSFVHTHLTIEMATARLASIYRVLLDGNSLALGCCSA